MKHELDIEQIKTWWSIYNPANDRLMEVRLIGKGTYSGYFKSLDVLLPQLQEKLDDDNARFYGNAQAYFVLNEINPQLYGREQKDRFIKSPKSTTTDRDIIRRRFVFIDFDSVKPADISASNAELEYTHRKSAEVYSYLKSLGFPEPCVAISGNGYRMTYACDMEPNDDTDRLVKDFLEVLADKFGDEHVDIDCKVFNRARIDKIIGTWAKKGSDDGKDRMWRLARYVKVPDKMEPVPVELFHKVADLKPKDEPKPQQSQKPAYRGNPNEPFDIEAWLRRFNIEYRIKQDGNITKYQLRKCPWEETHSTHHEWDSAICKMPDGKLAFTCFHDHCKDKTWADVRRLYEPEAYTRQYQPRTQYRPIQAVTPDIKPETETLGKKWLNPSSIKKINLYDLPKVKTGFDGIDSLIGGLHFFEYTILSGVNGCGKSSWLNTLILNIINNGEKVALWSGELPAYSLMTWIDLAAAGPRHLTMGHSKEGYDYSYVSDSISERIRKWLDGKLVIYNSSYGNKWEQLFNDMEELIAQGFKIFILDNLSAMDVDFIEGDTNKKDKTVVESLHGFCIEKKVHIILVVHPRKGTARGQRSLLRKEDISGSGAITNLADNVFIIHRNNEDFRKGIAEFFGKEEALKYSPGNSYGDVGNVIEICKNRMFGKQDKMIRLYFEPNSRRFLSASGQDYEYGWNDGATAEPLDLPFGPLPEADDTVPF